MATSTSLRAAALAALACFAALSVGFWGNASTPGPAVPSSSILRAAGRATSTPAAPHLSEPGRTRLDAPHRSEVGPALLEIRIHPWTWSVGADAELHVVERSGSWGGRTELLEKVLRLQPEQTVRVAIPVDQAVEISLVCAKGPNHGFLNARVVAGGEQRSLRVELRATAHPAVHLQVSGVSPAFRERLPLRLWLAEGASLVSLPVRMPFPAAGVQVFAAAGADVSLRIEENHDASGCRFRTACGEDAFRIGSADLCVLSPQRPLAMVLACDGHANQAVSDDSINLDGWHAGYRRGNPCVFSARDLAAAQHVFLAREDLHDRRCLARAALERVAPDVLVARWGQATGSGAVHAVLRAGGGDALTGRYALEYRGTGHREATGWLQLDDGVWRSPSLVPGSYLVRAWRWMSGEKVPVGPDAVVQVEPGAATACTIVAPDEEWQMIEGTLRGAAELLSQRSVEVAAGVPLVPVGTDGRFRLRVPVGWQPRDDIGILVRGTGRPRNRHMKARTVRFDPDRSAIELWPPDPIQVRIDASDCLGSIRSPAEILAVYVQDEFLAPSGIPPLEMPFIGFAERLELDPGHLTTICGAQGERLRIVAAAVQQGGGWRILWSGIVAVTSANETIRIRGNTKTVDLSGRQFPNGRSAYLRTEWGQWLWLGKVDRLRCEVEVPASTSEVFVGSEQIRGFVVVDTRDPPVTR